SGRARAGEASARVAASEARVQNAKAERRVTRGTRERRLVEPICRDIVLAFIAATLFPLSALLPLRPLTLCISRPLGPRAPQRTRPPHRQGTGEETVSGARTSPPAPVAPVVDHLAADDRDLAG